RPCRASIRRVRRQIRIGFLAAFLPFLCLSLRAQSPNTTVDGRNEASASTAPKSARQTYDEGQRAEVSGDWETAFRAYQQAAALAPDDRAIQVRAQMARSALAQQRTEQAERQLLSGNPALARAILQSAIQVDPSYTVALERLQELAQTNPLAALPSDNLASTLPAIKGTAGKRNFDYNGTTHGAYEEIAR